MSSVENQKDAEKFTKEQPMNKNELGDSLTDPGTSKKRRWTRRSATDNGLRTNMAAAASGSCQNQTQTSRTTIKDRDITMGAKKYVAIEKDSWKQIGQDAGRVAVKEEPGHDNRLTFQSLGEKTEGNKGRAGLSKWKQQMRDDTSISEEAECLTASVSSKANDVSDGTMTVPENEEPIELCLFSSDGSVEPTHESLPCTRVHTDKALRQSTSTTSKTSASIPATPTDTTSTVPALMTAAVTQLAVNRTMRRRKRRKKLSYSSTRNKADTKVRQEQGNVPTPPALVDALSIVANGYSAANGTDADIDSNTPSSPVYPNADASHLYPSTSEGTLWQWEDLDPYVSALVQSDLDTLMRWRKDNANCIAANRKSWCDVSGMESKRALLETIVMDASDASTAHVEFPIRRGRHYVDVWEEIDFLGRQKCGSTASETHVKSRVGRKTKRKGVFTAETSLLVSHRDLVYGYDDDRFQEFQDHLLCRVKACQPDLSPVTPPMPCIRRQRNANTNVDGNVAQPVAEEVAFDEEVLPTFPISQLHPASLGLWKLRKKQEPDYTVVHPASVNRSQVPARWKEEMEHHYQQQYKLQLEQTEEVADSRDGDDECIVDRMHDHFCAIIWNHQVTGALPSFGNSVEEDEISQTLAASIRSLIPLSIYNWRTAQLVYERAACSIQCAPILEAEATAAQELEDMYVQLCCPNDTIADVADLPASGITRQPRTLQIRRSTSHDIIAHSLRHDVADNCSLAVAASVEFALTLRVGDVVDVLDRDGCWNNGEVVEMYSEDTQGVAKFLSMRFSLWPEDTVEWISVTEGRILPPGVADGSQTFSVGPTRAHRVRIRYDQSLARELELSFPKRQAKQVTAASQMLAQWQYDIVPQSSSDLRSTPQKRKRKCPTESAIVATTLS